jgi:hypothetical protein
LGVEITGEMTGLASDSRNTVPIVTFSYDLRAEHRRAPHWLVDFAYANVARELGMEPVVDPAAEDDAAMAEILGKLAEKLVGTREKPRAGVLPKDCANFLDEVKKADQRRKFLLSAQASRYRLDLALSDAARERVRPEFAGLGLTVALAAFLGFAGTSGGFAPEAVAVLATALGVRAAWRLWLRHRNRRRVKAADEQWQDVLLHKVLTPFFIQQKNDLLSGRHGNTVDGALLQPTDYGRDPEYAVTTDAMSKVSDASRTVTAGSIGISGPRGAGKTTILTKLDTRIDRTKPDRDIRVYVSAPVDYDAREFIIHLFTELCKRVLAEAPPLSPIAGQTRRELSRLRFLSTYSNSWAPSLVPSALLAPLGLAGLAGTLGGLAWTPGRQKAEQPAGLPAIVEQFRAYSRDAAEWARSDRGRPDGKGGRKSGEDGKDEKSAEHNGRAGGKNGQSDGRVIICIDEMDKIRDSERAVQFLNGIKAIFDVPGCLYLVSVSEDAMAIFASQTPAIKTAFDSAFDEIIRVEPMTFTEARDLLDLRVTGVPLPFLALCHVLAGGVPRELIRASRSLYQVAKEFRARQKNSMTLGDMTQRLVRDRCLVMRQEAILQLGRTGAPPAILQQLYQENWPGKGPDLQPPPLSSAGLTAAADKLARAADEPLADTAPDQANDEWKRMCLDVEVAVRFYAAVIKLFAEPDKEPGKIVVADVTAKSYKRIDELAIMRHAMRMNSGAAAALLDAWPDGPSEGSSRVGN